MRILPLLLAVIMPFSDQAAFLHFSAPLKVLEPEKVMLSCTVFA